MLCIYILCAIYFRKDEIILVDTADSYLVDEFRLDKICLRALVISLKSELTSCV